MRDRSILESAPRGWRRPGNVDLHLDVGPATVIAKISSRFARSVIDDDLEQVVARLAETCHGAGLAVGEYSSLFAKANLARSSKLEPFVTQATAITACRGRTGAPAAGTAGLNRRGASLRGGGRGNGIQLRRNVRGGE